MKSMGINKLGHRKKLIKKIAGLRGDNSIAGSSSATNATSTAADSSEPDDVGTLQIFPLPATVRLLDGDFSFWDFRSAQNSDGLRLGSSLHLWCMGLSATAKVVVTRCPTFPKDSSRASHDLNATIFTNFPTFFTL